MLEITVEEAIEILKFQMSYYCDLKGCEEQQAFAMAIKAIKALKKEPCEDCISRQAVIEYIEGSEAELGHSSENKLVCQDIKELPTVTPQPKTGYWIFDETLDKHYYCSECKSIGVDYWDYCPYCGSKNDCVTWKRG